MIEIKQLTEITPQAVDDFANLICQLAPDSKSLTKEDLETIVTAQGNFVFVACNPKIIGTLTLVVVKTPAASKAWIEDVVVDNSARGMGVGEQLITHAVNFARKLDVSSVNLTSMPEREAANKLYQRMNFVLRKTNVYRLEMASK